MLSCTQECDGSQLLMPSMHPCSVGTIGTASGARGGSGRSVSDPTSERAGRTTRGAEFGKSVRGAPRRMSTFQMLTQQMSTVIDTVGEKVRKPSGMAAEAAITASEADRKRRGLNRCSITSNYASSLRLATYSSTLASTFSSPPTLHPTCIGESRS